MNSPMKHLMKKNMQKAIRKPVKGFTLLEILVSLAIFAMLGVATYSVINTTVNGHEAITHQNKQLTDLQRAFVIIENDFSQLAQRKVAINGEEPRDEYFYAAEYLFESETMGFTFVRDGWTNPVMVLPRSEMQLVAYRLIEKRLERLYFNFVDNEYGTEPKVQVLLNGVEELTLSYFNGGKWDEEKSSDSSFGSTASSNSASSGTASNGIGTPLPAAIKLSLKTDTFGLIDRNFLIIENTKVNTLDDN